MKKEKSKIFNWIMVGALLVCGLQNALFSVPVVHAQQGAVKVQSTPTVLASTLAVSDNHHSDFGFAEGQLQAQPSVKYFSQSANIQNQAGINLQDDQIIIVLGTVAVQNKVAVASSSDQRSIAVAKDWSIAQNNYQQGSGASNQTDQVMPGTSHDDFAQRQIPQQIFSFQQISLPVNFINQSRQQAELMIWRC